MVVNMIMMFGTSPMTTKLINNSIFQVGAENMGLQT